MRLLLLSGRPKGSKTSPARRVRPDRADTSTAELGAASGTEPTPLTASGRPRRKSDPTAPRQSRKRSLLGCLLADPRLTVQDKKAIQQAHVDGLTLADLASLTVYELRLAQVLFAAGELAAKDIVVAVGRAASHVAAAAQLGQASGPASAAITVTFAGDGPSSDRPEALTHAARQDPDVGDLIDVDQ